MGIIFVAVPLPNISMSLFYSKASIISSIKMFLSVTLMFFIFEAMCNTESRVTPGKIVPSNLGVTNSISSSLFLNTMNRLQTPIS